MAIIGLRLEPSPFTAKYTSRSSLPVVRIGAELTPTFSRVLLEREKDKTGDFE